MNAALIKINRIAFGQTVFWAVICGVIILVFAYIYLVNAIVWHVASRQQTERALSEMTAKVAALESKYVGITSNLNIDSAYAMGFKDTSSSETTFVKRSATLGSLSMRQVQ